MLNSQLLEKDMRNVVLGGNRVSVKSQVSTGDAHFWGEVWQSSK